MIGYRFLSAAEEEMLEGLSFMRPPLLDWDVITLTT